RLHVGALREAVESTHVGRDRGEAGGGIDGEEPLERLRVPRFVGTPEGVDDVEGLGGRRQRLAGGLGLGKRRRRRGRAAPLPRRRAREDDPEEERCSERARGKGERPGGTVLAWTCGPGGQGAGGLVERPRPARRRRERHRFLAQGPRRGRRSEERGTLP